MIAQSVRCRCEKAFIDCADEQRGHDEYHSPNGDAP
jgi:hypothetical protein